MVVAERVKVDDRRMAVKHIKDTYRMVKKLQLLHPDLCLNDNHRKAIRQIFEGVLLLEKAGKEVGIDMDKITMEK